MQCHYLYEAQQKEMLCYCIISSKAKHLVYLTQSTAIAAMVLII